jgi:RNA polymerase sigma-70 factor (ECF subfamily)
MGKQESFTVSDLATVGKLLEEHRLRLLTMVQRRIDPALAVRIEPEEILHEVFLKACRKWADYRKAPTMTPYAWLYRLTLDCLIEAWRRESRACRDVRRDMPWPEQSSIQLGLHLMTSATRPSEALARKELQEQIREVMNGLPARDQEILWMRHHDQLSFKEAGMVLEISENAATVRYVRALRRLKDKWFVDETGGPT